MKVTTTPFQAQTSAKPAGAALAQILVTSEQITVKIANFTVVVPANTKTGQPQNFRHCKGCDANIKTPKEHAAGKLYKVMAYLDETGRVTVRVHDGKQASLPGKIIEKLAQINVEGDLTEVFHPHWMAVKASRSPDKKVRPETPVFSNAAPPKAVTGPKEQSDEGLADTVTP